LKKVSATMIAPKAGEQLKISRTISGSQSLLDRRPCVAKLTKRSLYDNFESKDKLLEEVLAQQHEFAYTAFQSFGKKLLGKPEAIVDTYFGELQRWSGTPRWSGSTSMRPPGAKPTTMVMVFDG